MGRCPREVSSFPCPRTNGKRARDEPQELGGNANHRQEPWQAPLPQYIEELYLKRFKKEQPDNVRSIEQMLEAKKHKQAERSARKRQEREGIHPGNAGQPSALPDGTETVAEDDSNPFKIK